MFEKVIKKMGTLNVFDWAIFKICLISFALLLAVLIPELVENVSRYVYAIIAVLSYSYIIWRLFLKK